MNVKSFVLAALASSTLAACGSGGAVGDAAKKIESAIDKTAGTAELSGDWSTDCDQKNLLWSVAGVKSQKTTFSFYDSAAKTVKLFSDDSCKTEIGQVKYTGKTTVGDKTGGQDKSATILDLEYNKVEVTVSNDTLVGVLNLPVTPGCGINNWVAGQGRDVTAAAGGPTCPIEKATDLYTIAKADGQTLHFGRTDTAHNGATREARPVELDQTVTFKK